MNTLGKVFTVAILVACIFLMAGAMLVYSTHTNWNTKYDELKQRFDKMAIDNQNLESKYMNQVSQLKAEGEAAQQEVRKLESERVTLVDQNRSIQSEVDELQRKQRENVAAVAATEENNKQLTTQVADLRQSIRESQEFRDKAFTTTLRATSDLHVTKGDLETAKTRNEQLVQQLAEKTSSLRENGIDPNAKATTRVRGKISQTRRADGGQLIELTVGTDDGIVVGQNVEIFRGERYLGRAEILKADPDRAVARVLRQFQQGQIQEGDDVATKLRVF